MDCGERENSKYLCALSSLYVELDVELWELIASQSENFRFFVTPLLSLGERENSISLCTLNSLYVELDVESP